MKANLKRMMAVIMAAATLSVGTVAMNGSAYAANTDRSFKAIEKTSPKYEKYQVASFHITSALNAKTDSVTVVEAPAKLSYESCTTGSALVTIQVNGSTYGNYVIPQVSGATANIPINCSVGDTISYTVTPYTAGNYVKAVGSLSIYY